MKIAIVILNWNGRDMLKRFLPILQSNLIADSVVFVADNASSDDSLQLLNSDFPDVRVLELDKNYGPTTTLLASVSLLKVVCFEFPHDNSSSAINVRTRFLFMIPLLMYLFMTIIFFVFLPLPS